MNVRTSDHIGGTAAPYGDMVLVPGGTFRIGSDSHHPEEAPVHRVAVDSFCLDHAPVTNRPFKEFVRATGYVTFAEMAPNPKHYPGALPHMLYAGSPVFQPPKRSIESHPPPQARVAYSIHSR